MLSPYPAIAEMTCFIRGLTDVRDFESRGCRWWRANLNDYNTRNNTPYNLDLGPIYGKLWRSWSMGRVAAPWPKLPVGVPATVLGVANGSGTGVLQNDRLYRCWNSMIARCYSKDNKNYDTYGAKGVHVCNRWLEFKNFYMDAKTLPGWNDETGNEGLQIDKDKRPGATGYLYSPETCWWVTAKENSNKVAKYTYELERQGKTYFTTDLTAFGKEHGVNPGSLSRLFRKDRNIKQVGGFYPVATTNVYEPGFDQLAWLLEEAENNPHSRRLVVTAWDPSSQIKAVLPPCHYAWQIFIDGDTLDLKFEMRSVDWVLGCPADFIAYGFLQEALCRHLGKLPGKLVGSFGDAHIYKNHIDGAKELLATSISRELPIARWDKTAPLNIFEVERHHITIVGEEQGPSYSFKMAV